MDAPTVTAAENAQELQDYLSKLGAPVISVEAQEVGTEWSLKVSLEKGHKKEPEYPHHFKGNMVIYARAMPLSKRRLPL